MFEKRQSGEALSIGFDGDGNEAESGDVNVQNEAEGGEEDLEDVYEAEDTDG